MNRQFVPSTVTSSPDLSRLAFRVREHIRYCSLKCSRADNKSWAGCQRVGLILQFSNVLILPFVVCCGEARGAGRFHMRFLIRFVCVVPARIGDVTVRTPFISA